MILLTGLVIAMGAFVQGTAGIGLALLLGGVVVLRRPPARRQSRLSR